MSELEWSVIDEGRLTLQDHEAMTAMLGRAFPDASHWLIGGRSWTGMEPELRVLARDGEVVIAHVGIRRMFVDVGGQDLLVGCVGLVAVNPDHQGSGLGGELLARTARELERLAVPFGLLQTGERRFPFYRRNGWHLLEDTVGYYTAFSADGAGQTVIDDEGWFVLPVTAAVEEWPRGELRWNAQQV